MAQLSLSTLLEHEIPAADVRNSLASSSKKALRNLVKSEITYSGLKKITSRGKLMEALSPEAKLYITALQCKLVIYEERHDLEQVNLYEKNIKTLRNHFKRLDVGTEADRIFAVFQQRKTEENYEKICFLGAFLHSIKEPSKTDHQKKEIETFVKSFLQINCEEREEGLIKNQLRYLTTINSSGSWTNIDNNINITTMITVAFLLEERRSEELVRDLFNQIECFKTNNIMLVDQIDVVKEMYFRELSATEENGPGGLNKAISICSDEFFVSDRNQLNLETYPVYVNRKISPAVYTYRGSINFDTGREILVTVKEYVTSRYDLINPGKLEKLWAVSKRTECKYYGSYEFTSGDGKRRIGVVTERIEKTLMDEMIERKNSPYTEEQLREMVRYFLSVVYKLHKKKVFHGDLKPHKISVSNGEWPKLILGDFPFSPLTENKSTTLSPGNDEIQGLSGYCAPELQVLFDSLKSRGKPQSKDHIKATKLDSFALGLVFLQLYTLRSVEGMNRDRDSLYQEISRVQYDWLKNILLEMLRFEIDERAEIKKVCEILGVRRQ